MEGRKVDAQKMLPIDVLMTNNPHHFSPDMLEVFELRSS